MKNKQSYEQPTVISLFTCGMGMDAGFEKAGFQTIYANDITKFACETIRTIKKKEIKKKTLHLDEGSIFDIPSKKILDNIGLEKGEPDIIIGGPPCQSFSTAGMRKGLKDDRGKAVLEYIKKVEEIRPKAFVFENVQGIKSMFDLDGNSVVWLTIIAGFSQSVVLGFTLFVFYKNLIVLKKHNEMTIERFSFQSNVEKYDLTLKFADWIKSELSEYVPYFIGDVKHGYLTHDEIKDHFHNISKNIITLTGGEIVFKSLMLDEVKKMYITLEHDDSNDVYAARLKLL